MDLATLLAAAVDPSSLSDEELAEVKANLKAAAQLARHGDGEHEHILTPEIVAQITEAGTAVQAIDAEINARAAASAELLAQADAAMAALAEDTPTEPAEGEAEETAAEGKAEETPAEETPAEAAVETPPAPAAEVPVPEPVAAASAPAPKPARRVAAQVRVPASHQPRAVEQKPRGATIIAADSLQGVAPGHQFDTLDDSLRALHDTYFSLRASGDAKPRNLIRMDLRDLYDDMHTLGADPYENSGKMAAHIEGLRRRQSLVASGGVPGPNQPRYELITYGTAERPVRDALPQFLAPRGAVTWNISPTIDDFVVDTTSAAINNASSATDVSGGSYKTVQEISAVTSASATVEAQYARLQHGNWADRFLPELMAAWMSNLQVRYARHNDRRRIAEIFTGSTHYANTPAEFGAYRDLKRQMMGVVAELKDHLRDPMVPLRVLMPEYVPAMLATDLIAQQPGDDAYRATGQSVAADMQSWFPNVNISFFYDGAQTNQRLLTTPTQPGGGASPRSATFDPDVDWLIFPEGTWAFLDGGVLDLGIVRDSTLNAANRFQTFTETWEVAAKFGPFSYWITSSLCAGGMTQIATAVNACGPSGS